jgi:uncharacterized membrane protein YphA (DoxX/SURF4 family)
VQRGGLVILLGAFVTLFSVPLISVLLVAIFTVNLPLGFSSLKLISVTAGAKFGPLGYEVDLLYITCLLAFVVGVAYEGVDTERAHSTLSEPGRAQKFTAKGRTDFS